MLAVRAGAWKDKNPGRSARRVAKRAAMKSLVEDYYTMDPGNFLEVAIILMMPGKSFSVWEEMARL